MNSAIVYSICVVMLETWNKGIKYLIPFFIGCVLFVVMKKDLLTEYGLFSEERLSKLMVCDWIGTYYLFYILEKRIPWIVILYFISREQELIGLIRIGIVVCQLIMGFLFAECFIRYGVVGIVFALTMGFPHVFLYSFGIFMLMKKRSHKRNIIFISVYIFVMIAGSILEIYCNPWLLKPIIEKIVMVS